MDDLALLRPKLARLKLSGMLDTLNERLQQALALRGLLPRIACRSNVMDDLALLRPKEP